MATKKKTTKKPAKAAAQEAKPAPAAKPVSKGKRYTPAERGKIMAFVDRVNAAKGRGGATEASKKFGVTQLTISTWRKKAVGTAKAAPARKPAKVRATKNPGDTLDQLVALRNEISGLESQLTAKRAQFDKLKAAL